MNPETKQFILEKLVDINEKRKIIVHQMELIDDRIKTIRTLMEDVESAYNDIFIAVRKE